MAEFPDIITWENWPEIMGNTRLFTPVARSILSEAGLECTGIRAEFPGTHAVFGVGENYVIKIYAPLDLADAEAERTVYRILKPLNMAFIPKLITEGVTEYGGHRWEYIVTRRVKGEAVREVWKDMSRDARNRAACLTGEWAKTLHAQREPFSAESALNTAFWQSHTMGLLQGNLQRLSEAGCRQELINAMLECGMRGLYSANRPVVLTDNDFTEDHLLVSGEEMHLIDFGDCRMGYACVEWPPLWFGMLQRDEEAFAEYIKAAGDIYSREEMLLACLLHGYGAPILLQAVPGIMEMHGLVEVFAHFPKER